MDKTINQLNELSAVKDNDELIIFDVTNGDSKKAKSGNFFGASINTFVCSIELGTPKAINISGLTVKTGTTLDVFFTSGYYGSADTDVMTLNVNTLGAKKIYACRDGSKIALAPHSCTRDESGDATAHYWFIQANTCLKLMYDATLDSNAGGWLILGNPIVLSSSSANKSYTVYADGWIEQKIFIPNTEWVNDGTKTVTYPIPFLTNYFATITPFQADTTGAPIYRMFGTTKDLSSFTFKYSGTKSAHTLCAEGY